MIKFRAYNPFIKQLRTDRGWRVELEVSQDQYDYIKDLPKLDGEVFDVELYQLDSQTLLRKPEEKPDHA